VQTLSKLYQYVSDLILIGYVRWIIWSEEARKEAEKFVYRMDENMKDR